MYGYTHSALRALTRDAQLTLARLVTGPETSIEFVPKPEAHRPALETVIRHTGLGNN